MEFQTYFTPEVSQALLNLGILFVVIVALLALIIVAKKSTGSTQRKEDCQGKRVPVSEDEKVCLEDQYAQSQIGPYVERKDDCPPCYCKIHGTNCPDIFRRLRELVDEFEVDSDHGLENGYADAATRLRDLVDELEG